MIKFIKTRDPANRFDRADIMMRLGEDEVLPDVIQAFEQFLRAVGYCFDGNIELVDDVVPAACEDKGDVCDCC